MAIKTVEQQVKSVTAKKATTKKAGAGKKSVKTKSTAKKDVLTMEVKKLINVSGPNVREQMIAEEAYYRAEKRGFYPEGQVDDWLEAELKVDTLLSVSVSQDSDVTH